MSVYIAAGISIEVFPKDSHDHWRNELEALKVGHVDPDIYDIEIGTGPLTIDKAAQQQVVACGLAIREWLEQTADLLIASIQSGDPKLTYLMKLLQMGMEPFAQEVVDYVISRKGISIPTVVRADIPDFRRAVEVNVVGGGWGTMCSLQKTLLPGNTDRLLGGGALDERFSAELRHLVEQSNPEILAIGTQGTGEGGARYFVERLRQNGLSVEFYASPDRPTDLNGTNVVVAWASDSIVDESLADLGFWDKYVNGNLSLLGSPLDFLACKTAIALPFHPWTKKYYSSAVRSIFPETIIVDRSNGPGLPTDDGRCVPWESVHELPRSQRRWILKYGGLGDWRACGSTAVFDLEVAKSQTQQLIGMALADAKRKDVWIVQRKIDQTYKIPVWRNNNELEEAKAHMRFGCVYYFPQEGGVSVLGGTSLFNRNWKVHGNVNSIQYPVCVE